jgi:hypothetical protein
LSTDTGADAEPADAVEPADKEPEPAGVAEPAADEPEPAGGASTLPLPAPPFDAFFPHATSVASTTKPTRSFTYGGYYFFLVSRCL